MSNKDWMLKRKIARMPKSRLTPDVLLGQIMEMAKAGEISSVYIGMQWKDGTNTGTWSNQSAHELCVHGVVAAKLTQQELFEGGNTYDGPTNRSA